jgi:hypothetical protein
VHVVGFKQLATLVGQERFAPKPDEVGVLDASSRFRFMVKLTV